MKSYSVMASAIFLLIMILPMNSAVAQQDAEEACISKAEEMQVPDDKFDDFILQCIEESTDNNN
jgi:hypothetical protein